MSKTEAIFSSKRLDVVDALRGFALMGIVFVHFMEQFYAGPAPAPHENYTQHIFADGIFDGFVNILMRSKFFMLFSFLFGLSFAIQMERRGKGFAWRFLWRIAILFAIGWLHHLFYRGDILTVYALVGVPLVFCYSLSNRWLLIVAAILMLGVPRLIIKTTNPVAANMSLQDSLAKPKEIVYWQTVKTGSWLDIAKQNANWGYENKMNFQFGVFGRGYQTLAVFLLGLYAGRIRLFENLDDKKRYLKRGLWWSLGCFLGCFVLGALLFAVLKLPEKLGAGWDFIIGIGLYDISNLMQTAFYIFAFLLLFVNKAWWRRQFLKLAPYGRMALTNYFLQSVIGTFIFFAYGFNQLDQFGSTVAAAIALIVFIIQRFASVWWLERFYYGPLEWLWRSLTFFEVQKFKRK